MWRIPFFLVPYLAAAVEWLLWERIAKPGRRAAAAWGAAGFLAASKNPVIWLFGGYWFTPDMPTWLFALLNGLEGFLWTGLPCFLAAAVVALFLRRGRGWAFAAAAVAAAGLAAYGIVEGVRVPSVVEREVWFADLPEEFDGYRIAHLSDLHGSAGARRWKIAGIVRRTNAAEPDLVAMTGDFVDGSPERWAADMEPLRELRAKDGVFASTGNHERYWGFEAWEPYWREWGVRFLRNESVEIRRGGAVLSLGGLDDPAMGTNPGAVFAGRGAGDFRVLMFHRPIWCARLAEEFGVRLQLSGHTHGGGTPGLDRLVANANEGHLRGFYREGSVTLHVSPGSGQWGGYAMRLFDPAEITILVLRRGSEAQPQN